MIHPIIVIKVKTNVLKLVIVHRHTHEAIVIIKKQTSSIDTRVHRIDLFTYKLLIKKT